MARLRGLLSVLTLASALVWPFVIAQADDPDLGAASASQFDYIVVGSGPGGGVVATRLVEGGKNVLLIEAGKDMQSVETTIPLYTILTWEDPQMVLDYYIEYYPPGQVPRVRNWYPRSMALGGCAVHNVMQSHIAHDWDWNTVADITGDKSWSANKMEKYFTSIENNLYLPKSEGKPLGHGYDGWLSSSHGPNLDLAPWTDPMRQEIISNLVAKVPRIPHDDWNTRTNDKAEGGATGVQATNATHTRSSIRDHIVATKAKFPGRFTIWSETYATKILTKKVGNDIVAIGVEYLQGTGVNPYSRVHDTTTEKNVNFKKVFARKEVIISGGPFETPKILMNSGIGPADQLAQHGIKTVVNLPGVGENYQDRVEMSVAYQLKQSWKSSADNCFFGQDNSDPCFVQWNQNHNHPYGALIGLYTHSYKSSPSLPYRDIWRQYINNLFRGFHRIGDPDPVIPWPPNFFNTTNVSALAKRQAGPPPPIFSNLMIKAHSRSKGYVRLAGNGPFAALDINRNLFQTAESKEDLDIAANAIQEARKLIQNTPGIAKYIDHETYPGVNYTSTENLKKFITLDTWGHHPCCTAKIGAQGDKMAVLDSNFKVRGVKGLRVVDSSAFPNVPGWYINTPTYMLSGKAADVILSGA